MIGLQTFNVSDLNFVNKLTPDGWDELRPHYDFYLSHQYCIPLKAIHDNQLVAVGALIIFDKLAWIGHVVVDSAYRNQGLGFQLTKQLIEMAEIRKCTTIQLIATNLGEKVYQKLGFMEDEKYIFLKGGSTHFEPSSDIFPYQKQLKPKIFKLYHRLTGEKRDMLLEPHLAQGIFYARNSKLEAFYLPTCGEGHILADNSTAGIEMLKIKLSTHNNQKFVLPALNNSGISFLKQYGFQPYQTAKRMYRGKRIQWFPDKIYSRIGGNVG